MSTVTVLPVESTGSAVLRLSEPHGSRPRLRGLSLFMSDVAALLVGSLLLLSLLQLPSAPFLSLSEIARLTIPIALLCAIGLYAAKDMHPAAEIRKTVYALALTTLVTSVVRPYASGFKGQVAAAIVFVAQAACVIAFRMLLRATMTRLGLWLTPTAIVGSGPLAERLIHALRKHKHIGLKPVVILSDEDGCYERYHGQLQVERLDRASRLQEEYGVSHVIIAQEELSRVDLEDMTERYTRWFEHVTLVPSGPALGSLSVKTVDVGGVLGLAVPRTGLSVPARLAKRSLDLSVALTAGVLAAPVFAMLYLATRLTSSGPVFYGQRRIGEKGRHFTAWKFRSMVTNADAVLEQHLTNNPELRKEWEMTQKLANDPRVLPIGKLLRKTSLDELPQLWNVIRGEMSLVGPRPIVDAEVPRYGHVFEYYKMVRPGVTGMWQISGRSNTTYTERVRYDEYFVRNWSIWLDVYILFRTVKTVLLREGAC